MVKKRRIADYRRVLVVEGYSDLLFYAEALEHLRLSETVFIKECNGRSDLDLKLQDLLTPGFLAEKTHVGVIVDADRDAQGAESRFVSLLGNLAGQTVRSGRWTESSPRVGLWIAPGSGQPGEIETLVWNAWSADPENEKPKACIEGFVSCMAKAGACAKSPVKGLLGSLLAIRNDDDPRLGPAARSKTFDFSRSEFVPLLEFLKGLGF
jgi:hypothetical protein